MLQPAATRIRHETVPKAVERDAWEAGPEHRRAPDVAGERASKTADRHEER
jgi:hypothetical protein